jgi:hypothetical protein
MPLLQSRVDGKIAADMYRRWDSWIFLAQSEDNGLHRREKKFLH